MCARDQTDRRSEHHWSAQSRCTWPPLLEVQTGAPQAGKTRCGALPCLTGWAAGQILLRMVDGVDASLVSLPQVSKAAQMRLCTWVKAGTRQSRQILRVLKLLPPIDAHATIQSIAVTAGGSMRRSGCDRAGPGSVRYAMLAASRSRSRSAPTSYLP